MTPLRTLSRISLLLFNSSSLRFVPQIICVTSDGGHGALKRHRTPFFFLHVNVCLSCSTLLTDMFRVGYSFSFGIEHVIYLLMKPVISRSSFSSILGTSVDVQVPSAETLSCYHSLVFVQ